jgi:hypothetical protein
MDDERMLIRKIQQRMKENVETVPIDLAEMYKVCKYPATVQTIAEGGSCWLRK